MLGNIFACGGNEKSPPHCRPHEPGNCKCVATRISRNKELCGQNVAATLVNPELIAEYRSRLTNLSWLMKSLLEPIARRAYVEDKFVGRFWEGRFKLQALRLGWTRNCIMKRINEAVCGQCFCFNQPQRECLRNSSCFTSVAQPVCVESFLIQVFGYSSK